MSEVWVKVRGVVASRWDVGVRDSWKLVGCWGHHRGRSCTEGRIWGSGGRVVDVGRATRGKVGEGKGPVPGGHLSLFSTSSTAQQKVTHTFDAACLRAKKDHCHCSRASSMYRKQLGFRTSPAIQWRFALTPLALRGGLRLVLQDVSVIRPSRP